MILPRLSLEGILVNALALDYPRERLELMYAVKGGVRDRLVDFSNPASGSFYFAPSVEMLDSSLG